jgi:hypothetical protein
MKFLIGIDSIQMAYIHFHSAKNLTFLQAKNSCQTIPSTEIISKSLIIIFITLSFCCNLTQKCSVPFPFKYIYCYLHFLLDQKLAEFIAKFNVISKNVIISAELLSANSQMNVLSPKFPQKWQFQLLINHCLVLFICSIFLLIFC